MSKKRQHILTYHAGRRGWVKKYRGKQHWVLYASRKSDRDKYREAVLVWNRMKAEIDAGEYERVKSERAAARSTSSAAAVPRTNPRQVSTAVTRFLRQKQVEVNGGQISVSRLKGLEYGLSRFGESFGRRSLGELNEKQIEDFRCEQLTRIATGEIKPSTLDQQFRSVRQFLRWCWKQRLLRDLPRNLDDLRVKIPRAEIEVFTPQEVKDQERVSTLIRRSCVRCCCLG